MDETVNKVRNLLEGLKKNFQCTICLDILSHPISTKCNHQFCKDCFDELFKKKKKGAKCPLCMNNVTKRSLQMTNGNLITMVNSVKNLCNAADEDCESLGLSSLLSQRHKSSSTKKAQQQEERIVKRRSALFPDTSTSDKNILLHDIDGNASSTKEPPEKSDTNANRSPEIDTTHNTEIGNFVKTNDRNSVEKEAKPNTNNKQQQNLESSKQKRRKRKISLTRLSGNVTTNSFNNATNVTTDPDAIYTTIDITSEENVDNREIENVNKKKLSINEKPKHKSEQNSVTDNEWPTKHKYLSTNKHSTRKSTNLNYKKDEITEIEVFSDKHFDIVPTSISSPDCSVDISLPSVRKCLVNRSKHEHEAKNKFGENDAENVTAIAKGAFQNVPDNCKDDSDIVEKFSKDTRAKEKTLKTSRSNTRLRKRSRLSKDNETLFDTEFPNSKDAQNEYRPIDNKYNSTSKEKKAGNNKECLIALKTNDDNEIFRTSPNKSTSKTINTYTKKPTHSSDNSPTKIPSGKSSNPSNQSILQNEMSITKFSPSRNKNSNKSQKMNENDNLLPDILCKPTSRTNQIFSDTTTQSAKTEGEDINRKSSDNLKRKKTLSNGSNTVKEKNNPNRAENGNSVGNCKNDNDNKKTDSKISGTLVKSSNDDANDDYIRQPVSATPPNSKKAAQKFELLWETFESPNQSRQLFSNRAFSSGKRKRHSNQGIFPKKLVNSSTNTNSDEAKSQLFSNVEACDIQDPSNIEISSDLCVENDKKFSSDEQDILQAVQNWNSKRHKHESSRTSPEQTKNQKKHAGDSESDNSSNSEDNNKETNVKDLILVNLTTNNDEKEEIDHFGQQDTSRSGSNSEDFVIPPTPVTSLKRNLSSTINKTAIETKNNRNTIVTSTTTERRNTSLKTSDEDVTDKCDTKNCITDSTDSNLHDKEQSEPSASQEFHDPPSVSNSYKNQINVVNKINNSLNSSCEKNNIEDILTNKESESESESIKRLQHQQKRMEMKTTDELITDSDRQFCDINNEVATEEQTLLELSPNSKYEIKTVEDQENDIKDNIDFNDFDDEPIDVYTNEKFSKERKESSDSQLSDEQQPTLNKCKPTKSKNVTQSLQEQQEQKTDNAKKRQQKTEKRAVINLVDDKNVNPDNKKNQQTMKQEKPTDHEANPTNIDYLKSEMKDPVNTKRRQKINCREKSQQEQPVVCLSEDEESTADPSNVRQQAVDYSDINWEQNVDFLAETSTVCEIIDSPSNNNKKKSTKQKKRESTPTDSFVDIDLLENIEKQSTIKHERSTETSRTISEKLVGKPVKLRPSFTYSNKTKSKRITAEENYGQYEKLEATRHAQPKFNKDNHDDEIEVKQSYRNKHGVQTKTKFSDEEMEISDSNILKNTEALNDTFAHHKQNNSSVKKKPRKRQIIESSDEEEDDEVEKITRRSNKVTKTDQNTENNKPTPKKQKILIEYDVSGFKSNNDESSDDDILTKAALRRPKPAIAKEPTTEQKITKTVEPSSMSKELEDLKKRLLTPIGDYQIKRRESKYFIDQKNREHKNSFSNSRRSTVNHEINNERCLPIGQTPLSKFSSKLDHTTPLKPELKDFPPTTPRNLKLIPIAQSTVLPDRGKENQTKGIQDHMMGENDGENAGRQKFLPVPNLPSNSGHKVSKESVQVVPSRNDIVKSDTNSNKNQKSEQAKCYGQSTTTPTTNPYPVVMTTRVGRRGLQLCNSIIPKIGGKLVPQYTDDVTHLLVETDASNSLSKEGYTFKYLMALISGLWIINYRWVVRSLQAERLLDEEDFEAKGDPEWEQQNIPKEYRMNKLLGRKLFSEFRFGLMGKFEKSQITKDQLVALLQKMHVEFVVIFNTGDFASSRRKTVLICDDIDELDEHEIEFASNYSFKLYHPDWLIECIINNKLLDKETFLQTLA